MSGSEIACDLERRRGNKPSPGTIYPALKELKEKGLVTADKDKVYSLTKKGERELTDACKAFSVLFFDVKDMFSCCKLQLLGCGKRRL